MKRVLRTGGIFAVVAAAVTVFIMATSELSFGLDPHGKLAADRFGISLLILMPVLMVGDELGVQSGAVWVLLGAIANGTIGFCFGALMGFTWTPAKPLTHEQELEGSYQGPRCVACRKPIEPQVSLCPHCGWTQPA